MDPFEESVELVHLGRSVLPATISWVTALPHILWKIWCAVTALADLREQTFLTDCLRGDAWGVREMRRTFA